jgi:hypothetical protein
MRFDHRWWLLLALVGIGACSRSVAPVEDGRGSSLRSAVTPGSSAANARDVRLRFVGAIVDRPRANYYVSPHGGPGQPCDTVPAWSVLKQVQWRPFAGADGTTDAGPARLGLEAARDTTQGLSPGQKLLELQAPDRAGGGTVSVWFFSGLSPDTWWAGPDPGRWPASSDGDGRSVDVTDWTHFTTTPAWPPDDRGWFGPDSFRVLPSQRAALPGGRGTFYEIFGNRIYARSEGDTVHQGAWIVFCNGGWDWDSPYAPKVDAGDPGLPAGYAGDPFGHALLLPAGRVGSPIGFRLQMTVRSVGNPGVPDGVLIPLAQTSTYPAFLPTSVFRLPQVVGYWQARIAGKVYALARAVDADELLDRSVATSWALADAVDAGGGTADERALRRKVLVFHVRPAAQALAARSADPVGRPVAIAGD